MSVIMLGISDLPRSRRFYVDGFGWISEFENDEIIFYQMNGFVLGTFAASALKKDMNSPALASPGAFALGHKVASAAVSRPRSTGSLPKADVSSDQQTARRTAAFAAMSRPRRSCLGDCLESDVAHRRERVVDLWRLTALQACPAPPVATLNSGPKTRSRKSAEKGPATRSHPMPDLICSPRIVPRSFFLAVRTRLLTH